jgi:glycosyltransferase involved in cell wall biosynthesis
VTGHAEGGEPLRLVVANWQDRENPQAGGAEIHLHEVFGRLAVRGHRVTAVTSGWPGAAPGTELDGIRVIRTGGRHSYLLAAPPVVRRVAREERAHLLVEDLNKVPLFSPQWSPVPVLLLVHHLFGRVAFQEAPFPLALATWLLERPIPSAYRRVPAVAVSESTRQDLVRRGLREDRIEVIHNGVDSRALTPDPGGARFPEPTLLYLGRLKRYKRVDLVLQAVAHLRDRGHPARLLVGGKGDHRGVLEALRDRLELRDRVRFLGFVSEEEKLELLRRSWVHVLTSPREGWGISNLDAAACGTPTVASDSPGLRDSVIPDRTGLLVPHGDVAALADTLERMLQDGPLRRRLGEGARAWAESLSWDRVTDRWEEVLRRAAG